jgi:hypothetical protein
MSTLLERALALLFSVACIGCVYVASATQSQAQQLDIDAIFRCVPSDTVGPEKCLAAREMILNNCTSCHNFAPVVTVQFERGGWHSLLVRHAQDDRMNALSEEDVILVEDYLAENFNDSLPPPELPAAFLEAWTSY